MTYALQTSGLLKKFGGFIATNNVSLNVEAGARHALIGPNGAGKTTLINLLTGFLEPTSGQVMLNGSDVTHLAQHQRVKRGLARTFQINRLFADLTVLESVVLAVNERLGLGARFFRPVGAHRAFLGQGEGKGADAGQQAADHEGHPNGPGIVDTDHLSRHRILGAGPDGPPDPGSAQHFARAEPDQDGHHKEHDIPRLQRSHPVNADCVQQVDGRQDGRNADDGHLGQARHAAMVA